MAHVRHAAGDRLASLELSLLIQHARVTADRRAAAARLGSLTLEQALESPFLLLGSVDAICDQLQELANRFGISHVAVFETRSDGFDQVVARLG